jgi:hypothetical protein
MLFASANADQLSLLQDVKKKSRTGKGDQMSALMESAKNMLKNGADSEATEFATEILADIADTVIPAIVDESRVQQDLILSQWSSLRSLIDVQLPQWMAGINQWTSEVTAASEHHHTCRQAEHDCFCHGEDSPGDVQFGVFDGACPFSDGKRECEMHLYELWVDWVAAEDALRGTHGHIHDHFCPPGANGTLHSFRVTSETWMDQYVVQKAVVDSTEALYDGYYQTCVDAHNRLDSKSAVCNGYQTVLEEKACSHSRSIHQTLRDFELRYVSIVAEWDALWENIRADELMRHREYKQIKVVECLLGRVQELNGRPCDEESGEMDTELSHCHQYGEDLQVCDFCYDYGEDHALYNPDCQIDATLRSSNQRWETRVSSVHIGVDSLTTDIVRNSAGEVESAQTSSHLTLSGHDGWTYASFESGASTSGSICMVYPERDERPPFCADWETAWTNCLPVAPPHPCDPLWTAREINSLPEMPQPEFSATNPGCNQYPGCSVCDLSDFDHQESENHVNTAVIKVDGCYDQGADPNRVVSHISDGQTAAIRCCTIAPEVLSCETRDLGGGCQEEVLFASAVSECEDNGMRLCTQTEIEARVCCSTGCNFDSVQIWVAPELTSVYGNR